MTMNGIDISNWQGGLNLWDVDCDFAIMKATEGTSFVDGYCDGWVQQCRAMGKPWGFYHFMTDADPTTQADFFVDNCAGYFGEGLPVLDYEATALNLGAWGAKVFLDRVFERTGCKCVIYMSKSVCNSDDWSAVANADYGLWFAQYASYDSTGYQNDPWTDGNGLGAWEFACMFQYSSSGRIGGYDGNLDIDSFYGDAGTWAAYVGNGGAQPAAQCDVADGVQLYPSNGTGAQKWRVHHNDDDTVSFESVSCGKYLDVNGASGESGTTVQVYPGNGTIAQKWKLQHADGDFWNPMDVAPYEIVPATNDGMRLDVNGASCESGARIQIYEANGTTAQRWAIIDNGDGTWTIVNNGNGAKLALDVNGGGKPA